MSDSKAIGAPGFRTAFVYKDAIPDTSKAIDYCERKDAVSIIEEIVSSCPDATCRTMKGCNLIEVHSGSDVARVECLDGDERISLIMTGAMSLSDKIALHIKTVAPDNREALSITPLVSPDAERHSEVIKVFCSLIGAIENELGPYLSSEARPVRVTVAFAERGYINDRFMNVDVVGCFFIQSENEQKDAILSDHGFEVVLNMDRIMSELINADSERCIMSIISTLPHEVIHALNFANASRGLTPLETYDYGKLVEVQDHYLETTFGSVEKEEQFTELSGLLIAKSLCTPEVIRQMVLTSGLNKPLNA